MPAQWHTIPIGTKSYQPRSGTQSIERLVNLYVEPSEQGGKTAATLYGMPGLDAWLSVGTGPIRGVHTAMGFVWVVSGGAIYAVDETSKAVAEIGAIDGLGAVRMTDNGTHVVIVAGTHSYAVNLSSYVVLPEINLIDVTYQDGYAIYVQRDTKNVWASAVDDLTQIPGLNVTTADAKADNVVACRSTQRELWVFKQATIEIYANAGLPNFPFSRAAFIEIGCESTGSVSLIGTTLLWLGRDKDGGLHVYRSNGYQAQPISTFAIERMITAAYGPSSSEALSISVAGHAMYVLTFADLTLVYDVSTGVWSEAASFGLSRWRVSGSTVARGAVLVGDYATGDIYTLDIDTYSDNGTVKQRTLVCPPLSDAPDPIFVQALELEIQAGVGLTSGQGSDPTVLLSWSDDDGATWSSDVEGGMGAIGSRRWRASFNRLGRSANRSFRFRISDPIKVAVLGLRARLEAGQQ